MQQVNSILFKKLTNKLQNFSPVNDTFDATGQAERGLMLFCSKYEISCLLKALGQMAMS